MERINIVGSRPDGGSPGTGHGERRRGDGVCPAGAPQARDPTETCVAGATILQIVSYRPVQVLAHCRRPAQECEYGRLYEGKPTRQEGSVSRLSVTEIDPKRPSPRRPRCDAALI